MKFLIFLLFFVTGTINLCGLLDNITISGNPPILIVNSAVAGSAPNPALDSSTTYDWSTLTGRKITGKINSNMPSGVTLEVQLNSTDGSSQGFVALTTTAKNLVTSLPILKDGTPQTITYRLSATIKAATVKNGTRTLTLTIQ